MLDAYLRDHRAAADAGLALAERCRRSNEGTDLAVLLGDITAEIAADRDRLDRIMTRLGVPENKLKSLASRAAELVVRVKSNGVFTHYSPSSRSSSSKGSSPGSTPSGACGDRCEPSPTNDRSSTPASSTS